MFLICHRKAIQPTGWSLVHLRVPMAQQAPQARQAQIQRSLVQPDLRVSLVQQEPRVRQVQIQPLQVLLDQLQPSRVPRDQQVRQDLRASLVRPATPATKETPAP